MSDELANTGKILIYQNEKGDTKIDVYFEEDTIWMTQKAMCELYQVAKSSVSEHISNFIVHAALLRQAFAHCGRFPTAASRRSLGRVSVPMWPFILSDRLLIIALVGRYPTN